MLYNKNTFDFAQFFDRIVIDGGSDQINMMQIVDEMVSSVGENDVSFLIDLRGYIDEYAKKNGNKTPKIHANIKGYAYELILRIGVYNRSYAEAYSRGKINNEVEYIAVCDKIKEIESSQNSKFLTKTKSNLSRIKQSYETSQPAEHLPEKWYGYGYAIKVYLGLVQRPQVDESERYSKAEIMSIGAGMKLTNKANGEGFYKGFKDLFNNINDMNKWVSSLNKKDRKDWKTNILKACENDASVNEWLKKQPN
jgi:hypothetical protein